MLCIQVINTILIINDFIRLVRLQWCVMLLKKHYHRINIYHNELPYLTQKKTSINLLSQIMPVQTRHLITSSFCKFRAWTSLLVPKIVIDSSAQAVLVHDNKKSFVSWETFPTAVSCTAEMKNDLEELLRLYIMQHSSKV